ncbi:hypothetical protein PIB30_094284 [Stylosanthes scabra]|uniref:Uncharacterized protein n=1 Tax=Stylosanthes scabra TaxID=79078 RepID=A0ABU6RVN9_9FABA|nr:hypothetical protein [Stylosanthes scabra]
MLQTKELGLSLACLRTSKAWCQTPRHGLSNSKVNLASKPERLGVAKQQPKEIAPDRATPRCPAPMPRPDDAEVNPKGECKEIPLRSGKALEDISKKVNVQPLKEDDKGESSKEAKV